MRKRDGTAAAPPLIAGFTVSTIPQNGVFFKTGSRHKWGVYCCFRGGEHMENQTLSALRALIPRLKNSAGYEGLFV